MAEVRPSATLAIGLLLCVWIAGRGSDARIFYTDSETQQTVALDVNGERLRLFRRQILNVLGLQEPPSDIEIVDEFASRYMSTLYRKIGGAMDDDGFNPTFKYLESEPADVRFDFKRVQAESHVSDTIISFVPKIKFCQSYRASTVLFGYVIRDGIIPDEERFTPGLNEFQFELSTDMDGMELISAELYFVLERGATPLSAVTVYTKGMNDLIPVGYAEPSPFSNSSLISLNITRVLDRWIGEPQMRRTLFVEIVDRRGRRYSAEELSRVHCFGVGFFVDESPETILRRVRRSIPEPEPPSSSQSDGPPVTEQPTTSRRSAAADFTAYKTKLFERATITYTGRRCRLRNFYVAFSDLGWESWVIAPMGYQADYCSGDCSFPLDSTVNPTNHAIVQTLVHVLDEKRAAPAKCAPTSMKSQSILFFDNHQNVVMKRYQNMRVKECGCQ
ncbi:bone morphogenic protein 6 [Aphelenchoides avenae]|nr:bone morphogenic protein 6 [Aphelenchus avenae]